MKLTSGKEKGEQPVQDRYPDHILDVAKAGEVNYLNDHFVLEIDAFQCT